MHCCVGLFTRLADGRFDANLLTFYGVIVAVVLAALSVHRLLAHGSERLARWTGWRWLDAVGAEAVVHSRKLLCWLTAAVVFVLGAFGLGYHLSGRDVRADLGDWYATRTAGELLRAACGAAVCAALVPLAWTAVRLVRRYRPALQQRVTGWVGRPENEKPLARVFVLLERSAVAGCRLLAAWAGLHALGLTMLATPAGFALCLLAVAAGARLAVLACRVLSRPVLELGDRRLGRGHFRHYWERIHLLFPFGERCAEWAVYVGAASWCARVVSLLPAVADFGPRVVECLGILFGTRVLIELLQVLLNEAFGLYRDDLPADPKGRTLVPLLQSLGQYLLYFGATVIMLGVLGFNVMPIMAGVSVIGLAVGLGAQSLVTDVVSGFFILFENQYLVGDYVQVGDAKGVVEAVGIRLTQVRDEQGKLYLIPNGQIKGVVNYSKGFVNAIVDYKVPTGSDLEGLFRAMAEAGRRLRATRAEVIADTQVPGLVALGVEELTARAVTKVKPGSHVEMQNEYRRLLQQVLDEQQTRLARAA